jgi:hypothetical protein
VVTTYRLCGRHVISDFHKMEGSGVTAINSFVLHAVQPVVVRTEPGTGSDSFLTELPEVTDLGHFAWPWLPHPDVDRPIGTDS